MSVDSLIVNSAVVSFGFYLFLYFLFFRFASSKKIFPWLMGLLVAGGVFNAVTSFILLSRLPGGVWGIGEKILFVLVAEFLYGLAAVLFILCFCGPNETSVRIRLLYEIGKVSPQGITIHALLMRYSDQEILERRLERLLASGEVYQECGQYRIKPVFNFFSFRDLVASLINHYFK